MYGCASRLNLACSVGVKPTRAIIRSPVAWIAVLVETKVLKPIDKLIERMSAS